MRAYVVQIFKAYGSPIPVDDTMVILGFSDNLANVVFLGLIKFTGKRRIYIIMLFGIFISSFLVSCYGFIYLPNGFTSFGQQNESFHSNSSNLAFVPITGLLVWNFCSFCGFLSMPFMLLSEIFPFK